MDDYLRPSITAGREDQYQHLWMKTTAAMKRIAHQSLALTLWRSTSDLELNLTMNRCGRAMRVGLLN